ncbi:hypothetical protein IW261DRAFT_1608306 [Armillaria novae-zelandiae]|uniref:SET domain-containing protein n=1 Tax=Armillaria novae-zelandiae TaxID=153914 RepID=A0AA39P764_9AGAR|nr:hypothetical protein IW261DRAFT_1608306 [Armillaria novae-zelandiae]
MKRGFLNSNNSSNSTVAPAKEKEILRRPTRTAYVFPDIPPEHSIYPCSPEIALKQMLKAQMRCMSIPLPSPYTNELSSLCIAPSETRTALFAMDDFPAPLETPFYTTYTIRDVPGAGKGMFTTKNIAPGDLILREHPVVVIPEVIPTMNGAPSQFIPLAVQNLPPKEKEAFLQLHDCKNFPDKVKGIVDTNAMNIGRLPGPFEGSFAGVALGLSRINHSCAPNAICTWHTPSFTFNITAFKPIKAGEQIFISYLTQNEILKPRATRIKSLQDKYAFTCKCSSCSLPKKESRGSDGRRALLLAVQEKLGSGGNDSELEAWIKDRTLPDDHVIKRSSLVLETMEREGVFNYGLWRYYYAMVCKAHCALENELQARKAAEKILVGMLAKHTTDGGWSKVVAQPQESNWWALRT